MSSWYKIAQNQDVFSRLEELGKQREILKEEVTKLSQQYLDIVEKDRVKGDEFYETILKGPKDAYRDVRQEWEREAKRLVSLGLMTIQDAKGKGYYSSGHESHGWRQLPKILYHVTTAKSKVLQEGLKTRDELNQKMGVGLGGGESNTISFTTNLNTAYAILVGLYEMKRVQEGKITVPDMIVMSKEGTGADRPYYDEFIKYCNQTFDMKSMVRQETIWHGKLGKPPDEDHEWQPVPETEWRDKDANSQPLYSKWKRKKTPEEISHDTAMLYNAFSMYRQGAGGLEYPLFFSADSAKLVNIPEEEIAIVQFKARQGAMGYPVGSLEEWRTGTGQGVDIVREIDVSEIPLASKFSSINWYQTSIMKVSMGNRWVPHIDDPEYQLTYLFNCTTVRQDSYQMEIIDLMDNNNKWHPTEKVQRYLERFVGALKDDYALSFKYCVYRGKPYVAAYFSSIHYVFGVNS